MLTREDGSPECSELMHADSVVKGHIDV